MPNSHVDLARYYRDRILLALANEKIVVFGSLDHACSILDGQSYVEQCQWISTGNTRESVQCLIEVQQTIWCSVSNRIYTIEIDSVQAEVKIVFLSRRRRTTISMYLETNDTVFVTLTLDSTDDRLRSRRLVINAFV
jgi:hypothetical protein